MIAFSRVATTLMLLEYNSSAKKSAAKEAKQNERLRRLENDIEALRQTTEMQTEVLSHLVEIIEEKHTKGNQEDSRSWISRYLI